MTASGGPQDRDVEDLLRSNRQAPPVTFRGELARRLLSQAKDLGIRPRPEHLWALVSLYAIVGFVLLVLILIGVLGAGPFAP
jgi:hypothetical protein